ncbi:hypothetical protein [Pseudophaeobacter sp.]|uniref:CBU_0592 family membrane protein n=1 Tax=Pseudophaeobacter sp. TaxID=1971739 RepID=UPI0032981E6E
MSELLFLLRQHPEMLQFIGVIGFSLYITAFTLLQTGRICGNSVGYTCFVVTAASCVLVSLVSAFNLAAFLIQASYVCLGLFGLMRRYVIRRMRFNRHEPEPLRQSFAAEVRQARQRRAVKTRAFRSDQSRSISQAHQF